MKRTTSLIAIVFVACLQAAFSQDVSFRIENLGRTAVRINGATGVHFSSAPGGLIITSASHFAEIASVRELFADSRPDSNLITETVRRFIGVLPNGSILFKTASGAFMRTHQTSVVKRFVSESDLEKLSDLDQATVIVSDRLIVSGNGHFDWGGEKGFLYQFDPSSGALQKGPAIAGFWYGSVSPSRRYILFEHGAEESNWTELYDLQTNRVHSIGRYFPWPRSPYFRLDREEFPIKWMRNADRFLAIIEFDVDSGDSKKWLVLFDVPSRTPIWKKRSDLSFFPSDFVQINERKAYVRSDSGIRTLSLATGVQRTVRGVNASSMSNHRESGEIAFVDKGELFVARSGFRNRRSIAKLPVGFMFSSAHKGMGERPPLWSPDGKVVFLIGKNEVMAYRVH
jgi:hypothetical protein